MKGERIEGVKFEDIETGLYGLFSETMVRSLNFILTVIGIS